MSRVFLCVAFSFSISGVVFVVLANPKIRYMKKYFPLFILIFFCANLKAQQIISPDPNASGMIFDSSSYHFGKVKQGERVNLELHFTNTGKTPLIISNCVTACGCDVATAPREPIPPGGSGIVKYTLDTTSRMGMQQKTITITYNVDQVLVINIYGEIITH